jgi:hypothetical protein
MQLSHSIDTNSTPDINDITANLADELKAIKQQARAGADYSLLETEIGQLMNQAHQEVLANFLAEYDIDVPEFESQGLTYKRAGRDSKCYMTAAGKVSVERSIYRTKRNGQTYCPLELRSGIIEGFWTPQAAKHAIHVVSLVTPGEAERLFKALGAMSPSSSSLTRLPAKLNGLIEKQPNDLLDRLNGQIKVPEEAVTVCISLDGVMVATRDQILPGDSKWREASCGTISFMDKHGKLLSTLYFARMPERLKRSLKAQLTSTIDVIMSQRPDLSVVKVADGAKDNWTFLEGKIKKGESILDYYHASEHLHKALVCIYGPSSAHVSKQHKKYRHILRDDPKGISKVIKHLEFKAKKKVKDEKELATQINYFKNNKHRCEYVRFKEENKPIGSGIVESACKTVVQMRCKRAGQRWDHDGGQAILRFRSLLLSEQLDQAWDYITPHYKNSEIKLPDNVVPFRRI